MTTIDFGDKKYLRPSLLAFSSDQPTINPVTTLLNADFNYLTDDNRDPVQVSFERIEQRQRMANGRMRSYHIADKRKYSINYKEIPSRAINPLIKSQSFISERSYDVSDVDRNPRYIAGDDMLQWYENHTGQFWLTMVYDKVHSMGTDDSKYSKLTRPSEVVPVFFEDFNFNIIKRGPNNDLWTVSMVLVEA
jgi:hypothetical protein